MVDYKAIQDKWQKKWQDSNVYKVEESNKKKFYCLEMFPYPSGSGLHMGHAFNYTIGDIYSRFKRMNGFNVLHPMGFDSLGLPAENAAIKNKSHPKKYTEDAIKNYISQMKDLGLSYDWSRKVETHKPDYYKWDQWIFLKLFEKGLAYRRKAPVNWCSKCNTVLANEQVHDGMCWRHEDTAVQIKKLEQWFFKTTHYADELYEKIDSLEGWPETVKKLQKNWIGKSYGTEIEFTINKKPWKIFTTRPDTLFGVTFMVIAAQHPKIMDLVTKEEEKKVKAFLKKIKSTKEEDTLEKEGIFTGSYAIHPLTKEKVPVYAGNFVLAEYGSGMVMAVPAHDQRDFEFAKKYKIPIKVVVQPKGKKLNPKEAYTKHGILINSDTFNGVDSEKAIDKITKEITKKKLGKKTVNFRLKDWLISRQRFWGTPIPIIYCDKCGAVPVPEKELPVKLPDDIKFTSVKNPLTSYKPFIEAKCPRCKSKAKRETDTMDTFVNSSWYFLRYTDPKNDKEIFAKKKANYWCPIDMYIGGKEHSCMHLIYFRFYTKFLRDLGLLKFDEPALKLFNQGMLHAEDGRKMSKSLGNVVLPEVISNKYGIDTARFFLVSIATPDKDMNWSDEGIEGSLKFMKKVMGYFDTVKIGKSSKKVESKLNKAIKEITKDIEDFKYNLATIKIRQLFDSLEEEVSKDTLEKFLLLLHPFCPHITEELWEKIGNKGFISIAKWPTYDEKKIDMKAEFIEDSLAKIKQDIKKIQELTGKKKLKKVQIIISVKWKYRFIQNFKKSIKKERNVGVLIKTLVDKEHGKEISKMVPVLVRNPAKVPLIVLRQSEEFKVLREHKNYLEKELDCKVEIVLAEKSKDTKAGNASPSKPAIIIS